MAARVWLTAAAAARAGAGEADSEVTRVAIVAAMLSMPAVGAAVVAAVTVAAGVATVDTGTV
jgi:hypothetical protein